MYPQFRTTGIGGILMKYSYEYKKKCVELYREGKWAEAPEGVSKKRFHDNIREWVRVEEAKGPEDGTLRLWNAWVKARKRYIISSSQSGRNKKLIYLSGLSYLQTRVRVV